MTQTQRLARNALFLKELMEFYISLKGGLKVFDDRQRKLAKWFDIEFSSTKRTGRRLLRLEPAKRLNDLLSATEALCFNGNACGALAHKKPPNLISTCKVSPYKAALSLTV